MTVTWSVIIEQLRKSVTCKHRWIETDWGKPWRDVNMHMYMCTRCHQCRIAYLTGNK